MHQAGCQRAEGLLNARCLRNSALSRRSQGRIEQHKERPEDAHLQAFCVAHGVKRCAQPSFLWAGGICREH
jgi:hypothetical protein